MKKFLSKRLLFILPGVVAYILNKYAQNHLDWAEQYMWLRHGSSLNLSKFLVLQEQYPGIDTLLICVV